MSKIMWVVYFTGYGDNFIWTGVLEHTRRDAIGEFCERERLDDGTFRADPDTTDPKVFWRHMHRKGLFRCVKVRITPVEEL